MKAVIGKFWFKYKDAVKDVKNRPFKGFKIIPIKTEKQRGFLVISGEVDNYLLLNKLKRNKVKKYGSKDSKICN